MGNKPPMVTKERLHPRRQKLLLMQIILTILATSTTIISEGMNWILQCWTAGLA